MLSVDKKHNTKREWGRANHTAHVTGQRPCFGPETK